MRSIDCVGDRLGVVEEPVQAVERHVAVDLLEHVERAARSSRRRWRAGGTASGSAPGCAPPLPARPPSPAACRGAARGSPRSRRPRRPASRRRRCGGSSRRPAGTSTSRVQFEEVVLLALRLLGEQVVGEADGQLAVVGQLLDDRVVVGIVLEAAAGVDGAGDAEAVQLAHEVARRVDLVLERQLRPLGQRRVQDAGVGPGEQQAGRVACGVALDLAAGRVRACPWCSRPRAARRALSSARS